MNDLLREHSLHLNFNQTDFQWAKFLTFEPLNLELQTFGPKIIFSSQSTQSQKVSRHIIIWRIGTLIFQSPYLRVHSSKLPWKMFLVLGVQLFSQKPSLGGKFSPLPKKALHPQRVLELSAKREIIQWIQHSWSNIIQKLRPWNIQCQFPNDISFRPVLAKIGFHPDVLAPPPPCQVLLVLHHPRKRRGKKGKKRPTYSSTKCPK